MYQCKKCGKVYRCKGWLMRHFNLKGHMPVWEELLPLSAIRKIIQEELSKLKFSHAEPIVRITKTEITEMPLSEYQRGSTNDYRLVMNELKSHFIDMEKAEVC